MLFSLSVPENRKRNPFCRDFPIYLYDYNVQYITVLLKAQ